MDTTNEPERMPSLKRFWQAWRHEILRGLVLFVLVFGVGLAVIRLFSSGRNAIVSRISQLDPGLNVGLGGPRQSGDTFHWQGKVSPAEWLYLRSTLGKISVEGGAGDQVEVTAVKTWRRSDPHTVHVVAVPETGGGGVTVCALWDASDDACGPLGEYRQTSLRRNDVAVDFTVRVPRGVKVDVRTVSGAVRVVNVGAPVVAKTVNGGIEASTAVGPVKATTVNGSVEASMDALPATETGDVELSTVNGSVTAALPTGVNADLEAKTLNGRVDTDFPLQVRGQLSPRHVTGRIGSGGRRVVLNTLNGSIRIKEGAPPPPRGKPARQ